MKKITSITMHTTSEGQRLSYTYSNINEDTGAVITENNRGSFVVLEIPANEAVLENIKAINTFVSGKLAAEA